MIKLALRWGAQVWVGASAYLAADVDIKDLCGNVQSQGNKSSIQQELHIQLVSYARPAAQMDHTQNIDQKL